MLTQGMIHVSIPDTPQLIESYQLPKDFKFASELLKKEYSLEEYILYIATLSHLLSNQKTFEEECTRQKIIEVRKKEELQLAYEITFLHLIRAFHEFLVNKAQLRRQDDEKTKAQQEETSAVEAHVEIEQNERRTQGEQQSFGRRLQLYTITALLTIGALISEASDGFLGGMTLVARWGRQALLIVAGILSAGFHAAVHYMVTIVAMKRQIGLHTKDHIIPFAKIHTEQMEALQKINHVFMNNASAMATFGGYNQDYITCSKAPHLFNERLVAKNKGLKPHQEGPYLKTARWFVALFEAIINASFSYFSIKLMFLFILGFASITPVGWGFFAFSAVIITLAAFATVANMLGDMDIGVIEAFNPGYKKVNAMFKKAPDAIEQSLECQREINDNIETTLTNELTDEGARLEKKIDDHLNNNIVILEDTISDLRQEKRLLKDKLKQAKENCVAIDPKKKMENQLDALENKINCLEMKNKFFIQEREVYILRDRLDRDFKLPAYRFNLSLIKAAIVEFSAALDDLKKITVVDLTRFDPKSNISQLENLLAGFQQRLKEKESAEEKPKEVVELEKKILGLEGENKENIATIDKLKNEAKGNVQVIENLKGFNALKRKQVAKTEETASTPSLEAKSSDSPNSSPVKKKLRPSQTQKTDIIADESPSTPPLGTGDEKPQKLKSSKRLFHLFPDDDASSIRRSVSDPLITASSPSCSRH